VGVSISVTAWVVRAGARYLSVKLGEEEEMMKLARSIVRPVAIIGATIAMALTMSIVSLGAHARG
jgi:hypothetical protein